MEIIFDIAFVLIWLVVIGGGIWAWLVLPGAIARSKRKAQIRAAMHEQDAWQQSARDIIRERERRR